MFKKILLSFLAANFLLFSIFATPVKAQTTWYNQTFFEWYDKVYDPTNEDEIFGERYTAAQVEWVIFSTFAWVINHIGIRSLNWCVINLLKTGLTGNLGGFFSTLATTCPQAIADLNALFAWAGFGSGLFGADTSPLPYASTVPNSYNPQAPPSNFNMIPAQGVSFVGYVRNIGEKFNIVPETKAQGFGADTAAAGMQNLWRFIRDLTYFLMVIAIIIMAFMIMFRVKLSPQTVVTLQSAIPKIIITLVLITFSYAIAGLLIDFMYVVLGLLAAIFTSPNGISGDSWATMFETFTQRNTVGLFVVYWVLWLVAAIWASVTFSGAIIGNVIAIILVVLIWVVLLIVLAILTFRILWMLIRNYVEILLLIVFSPIFILGGLVNVGGFGAWVRQMAARLAVYPMVAVLLVFAFYFLATPFGGSTIAGVNFIPFEPVNTIDTSNAWDPPLTFGSSAIELMFVFVSLVTLTLIPRAADIIRGAISGRPFAMGTAIGEAMAVPMGWGQAAAGGWRAGSITGMEQRMQSGRGTWGWAGSRMGVGPGGDPQRIARFTSAMERLKRT